MFRLKANNFICIHISNSRLSDSVVVVVVVKKGRQGRKGAKKENGKEVPL